MRAHSGPRLDATELAGGARRGPPAFTLVELVVVVVIIGIVAAMAIPRFAGSLVHRRLEAATRRVAADLALAQRRAKLTSASQTVTFDTVQDTYTLAGAQHLDHPADEYQVSLADDPYGAVISKADLGGDAELVFDGYGLPDSGGTITITVGDYERTVTVDPETGQASISDAGPAIVAVE